MAGGYADKSYYNKTFGEYDFGANADETYSFRLPPGCRGRLINIGLSITEVFACASTAASVELGITGDTDEYAKLTIADEAADGDFFDVSDDTDAIIEAEIAADTLLIVTLTQSTDDSADTGKGHPSFDFEIYQESGS